MDMAILWHGDERLYWDRWEIIGEVRLKVYGLTDIE